MVEGIWVTMTISGRRGRYDIRSGLVGPGRTRSGWMRIRSDPIFPSMKDLGTWCALDLAKRGQIRIGVERLTGSKGSVSSGSRGFLGDGVGRAEQVVSDTVWDRADQ